MTKLYVWDLGSGKKASMLILIHVHKQPTNELKIRILSETSILYLIRHASVILIVDIHM